MKQLRTLAALIALAFTLSACGGGNGSTSSNSGGQTGPKPIDPSGNWQMRATDNAGVILKLSGLFFQTGSVVTAASVFPVNTPAPYACQSWAVNFQAGTVQNGNQFSGLFAGTPFGNLTFTSTLNPAGTHFDGSYSGLAAGNCAGIGASGTFIGDEVPSVSGAWTGTLTPCSYDQQTGVCTNTGTPAQTAFTLAQDDQTGGVTGTYQVAGLAPFSTGSIAVVPPFDIFSGTTWQFTMTDADGSKFVVNGQLGLDRSFAANAFLSPEGNGTPTYRLVMTH